MNLKQARLDFERTRKVSGGLTQERGETRREFRARLKRQRREVQAQWFDFTGLRKSGRRQVKPPTPPRGTAS